MIITREIKGESVEITLTAEELRNAFLEQELSYDTEDVELVIKNGEKNGKYNGASIDILLKNKEDIARLKRDKLEDYGLDWRTACEEAIQEWIDENVEEDDDE